MEEEFNKQKIIIFDTTMRDGELMPGIQMDVRQKIAIAKLLEEMHVDIIEVGYPGVFVKDFEEIFTISKLVKDAIVCGLASTKQAEILSIAQALKPAKRPRIHIYTPVNLKERVTLYERDVLEIIQNSIRLARNYCDDIEWSAFDAPRSHPDFLCKTIETAIKNGATTIGIPDSFGTLYPQEFSCLIATIVRRVPNIDRATIAVHCHDDLGLAVTNSIAALNCGARQIECSINGLGARKGNADLAKVVREIDRHQNYRVDVNLDLLDRASELTLSHWR